MSIVPLDQVVSYYCVLIALSLHYLGSSCQVLETMDLNTNCVTMFKFSGSLAMDGVPLGPGGGWEVKPIIGVDASHLGCVWPGELTSAQETQI